MTAMLPQRSSDPADENLFGPVARLSSLASELAEMPLGPRPAFRADLRVRLMEEAGQTSTPTQCGRHNRGRRRYGRRAAAVGLALALGGGGVAAAAERSLPGEPLYAVKRLGQSVRLALDPGPGVGPSLRLISARISEAERTVAIDPTGADSSRWRGLDSALGDADSRLVQLSAATSAQELSAALAPDRARLARLLPAVPAAHQDPVRQLQDTIDGLTAAMPVAGAAALPADFLPAGQLSPTGALAAGWPLDPRTLRLPVAPTTPTTPTPTTPTTPTSLPQGGWARTTGGTTTSSHPGSSSTAGSGSSSGLPRLPVGGLPSTTQRSTSGGVLPRTTSSIGSTVDRTVGAALGGGSSTSDSSHSDIGGTDDSSPEGVGGDVVGDATDTVRRLSLTKGLPGLTKSR